MNILNKFRKPSFLHFFSFFALIIGFQSCDSEENELALEKNYSYNIEDIYTKPSSINFSRNSSVSDITYVIPTIYNDQSYDFEITTLSEDGHQFNVTFEKNGESYSTNFYVENNMIYPLITESNRSPDGDFVSCVANHDGLGVGFLTGACAGIATFIPGLQAIAFACASETAVIASVVAADCAINQHE